MRNTPTNSLQTNAGDATVDLAVYTVGRVQHSPVKPVELHPSANNKVWDIELAEPLVVLFNNQAHVVNAGFFFDGASIQYRWINGIIRRYGRIELVAAAVHDWYYSNGRLQIPPDVGPQRLWCDRLFRDLLIGAGASWARANLAYRAVRMFGDIPWQKGTAKGYGKPAHHPDNLGATP